MVGNYVGEERRMQESMAEFSAAEERRANERMVAGYNILRSALAWFSSHSVEQKLGHLPEWVVMARELTKNR